MRSKKASSPWTPSWKRKARWLRTLAACLLLLCTTSPAAEEAAGQPLEKVSLQLVWKHQFEFAGFYAAIEKGFYRERGLEVELREYADGLDLIDEVQSGRSDYGLSNSLVILARLSGSPLVLLANYFKRPPMIIVGQQGIRSLEDIRGKRLMIDGKDLNSPLIKLALRSTGLIPGRNLQIVPHSFDPGSFIRNEVDATTAFISNEPYFYEQAGHPYQVIDINRHLPALGDIYLFTSESEVARHPQRTRAFVEASNAGWRYAMEHPEEIIDLILTKYSTRKSRDALRYEAQKIRELVLPVAFPIGSLYRNRIEQVADVLVELDQVPDKRRLEGFIFENAAAPRDAGPELSPEEWDWLHRHPVIRVAVDPGWAPVEFVDGEGRLRGISSDYLQRLGEMLGVRFEAATDLSWQQAVAAVKRGELDMFASVRRTPERSEYLEFSAPYVSMPIVIFTREESPYIGDLHGLKDKRVAVVKDYAIHELLTARHPHIGLVPASNTGEALKLLAGGEVDAFVGNILTTSYYIGKLGLSGLKVAGETPYRNDQAMAVPKNRAILARILRKALAVIPHAERDAIYQRWISIRYEHGFDFGLLWKLAAVAALILAVFAAWAAGQTLELRRRRAAEAAMRLAKDSAETANRAKSEFLANMSHELRTPLNAVLGFSSLLQESEQDARNRGYLDAILSAGKSLLQLLDDILDLSRIEANRVELSLVATDPRELVRELESLFCHQADDKGLALHVEVGDTVPARLDLDAARLRQILVNLIGNAIKFTDHGRIDVRVEAEAAGDGGYRLEIGVEDTGIGVPPEYQRSIFELFTQRQGQNHARYGGTGLGLAISRRLAGLMGGTIRLHSEPGVGSRFTLALPRVTASTPDAMPKSAEAVDRHLRFAPAEILVVEDAPLNRGLLLDYLRPYGFHLRTAEDGEQALAAVARHRPQLILMDIAMPVLDGLEATRRLKADPATVAIPVIAVTASATDEREIRELCDGYLRKPVARVDLITALLPFLQHSHDGETAASCPAVTPAAAIGQVRLALSHEQRQRLNALHSPISSINEIEAFARELVEAGEHNADDLLERAGRQLLDQVGRFDMQGIRETIAAMRGKVG